MVVVELIVVVLDVAVVVVVGVVDGELVGDDVGDVVGVVIVHCLNVPRANDCTAAFKVVAIPLHASMVLADR